MLLHVDFKLLSLVFFAGIAIFAAAKSIQGFSVRYVESNLPSSNQEYIYEAIGMLQVTLDQTESVDAALPKFLTQFQNSHDFETWEVSSGCNILILPSQTSYIKMDEITTDTEINLFASGTFLSTTESSTVSDSPPTNTTSTYFPTTDFPSTYSTTRNSYTDTPTINPYTTASTTSTSYTTVTTEPTVTTSPPPLPFSVKITGSNVPNQTYLYKAIGILQYYLGKENSLPEALPLFLKTFQSEESNYIWKLSSKCKILLLPNSGVYIDLLEEYTNTEIHIFG